MIRVRITVGIMYHLLCSIVGNYKPLQQHLKGKSEHLYQRGEDEQATHIHG